MGIHKKDKIVLKKIVIIHQNNLANKRKKGCDNKSLCDGDGLTLWATHSQNISVNNNKN